MLNTSSFDVNETSFVPVISNVEHENYLFAIYNSPILIASITNAPCNKKAPRISQKNYLRTSQKK